MSDAPQGNSVLAFLASEFGAQELPTLSYLANMLTQEEETTKPTAVAHTDNTAATTTTSTQEAETSKVAEQQQCVDTPQDAAVERKSVPLPLIPGTSMLDFVIRNLCQDKHAFPCLHLLQEQLQHDEHDNNKEEEAAKKANVPAESIGSHAVTLSTEADKDLTEDMIMIGEAATTVLQQEESVKDEEEDNQQVVVAAMTSEVLTSPSSVQHTEPDNKEEEAPRARQRKVSNIPVIVGVTESTQPHKTKRTARQIVTEQKTKASNTTAEEEGNARWQAGRRPRRISETLLTQLRQQLHARRSSQPTAVAVSPHVGSPHVIQHPQAEEAHKAEDASEVVARVRRGFVERYLDNLYGRKRSTPLAKPSPHSRRFPLHGGSPVDSAKKPQETNVNAVVEEDKHQILLPEPHPARHNNNNNAIGKHHTELEQRVSTPHAQQQRLDTHTLEEEANILSSQIATPRQLAQRHVTSEFFQDYRVPLHTPRTPSQPLSRHEPRRPSRLTGVHDVLATPNSQPYGSRRNSHSIRLHHDNPVPPPATGNAAANRMKSPIVPVPAQRRRSSANGRQQGRPPSALRVQQQQQPLGIRNSLDLVVVGKTVKMAQSQPHRPSSAIRR